jgi:hypothetical protein
VRSIACAGLAENIIAEEAETKIAPAKHNPIKDFEIVINNP